jgi:hypothetical protein
MGLSTLTSANTDDKGGFRKPLPYVFAARRTVGHPEKLEADQLLAKGGLSPTKPGAAAQRSAAKSKRGIMPEPLAYVLEQILR